MDAQYDPEMKKLCNWLLFGLSATDIHGGLQDFMYEDSYFVISKDGFQAYTNSAGFKSLSNLTTLITNLNLYVITKSDEEDNEKQEVIKVARFFEFVHDKKIVGLPARKVHATNDFVNNETQMVEKWPIMQAYGLDMVGGGFFTMKHNFINLRDEMEKIY